MTIVDLYTGEILEQYGTDTETVLYTTKSEWAHGKQLIEEQERLKKLKAEKGGKDGNLG